MRKAEVELPDTLYEEVEELADESRMTVPELLRTAAERMVHSRARPQATASGDWQFPGGRRLGAISAPVEDWRLLANEVID